MLFIIHLYWYLFDMHVPVSFHFLCIASLGISATGNMNMNTVSCPNCSVGLASIPLLTPMFGFFYFCLHCHRLQGPNEKRGNQKSCFTLFMTMKVTELTFWGRKEKKKWFEYFAAQKQTKKNAAFPASCSCFQAFFHYIQLYAKVWAPMWRWLLVLLFSWVEKR